MPDLDDLSEEDDPSESEDTDEDAEEEAEVEDVPDEAGDGNNSEDERDLDAIDLEVSVQFGQSRVARQVM